MRNIPHSRDRRDHDRAVSIFVDGLPDYRLGRLVTASSDVDSWKRKPAHIQRRLASAERALCDIERQVQTAYREMKR